MFGDKQVATIRNELREIPTVGWIATAVMAVSLLLFASGGANSAEYLATEPKSDQMGQLVETDLEELGTQEDELKAAARETEPAEKAAKEAAKAEKKANK